MPLPWTIRLYHFLKGPNPLHPKVWSGRLAPLAFRRFTPEDMEACLDLYVQNEPDRFPNGAKEDYFAYLREQKSYMLVGERDGRLVACGGLHYIVRKDIAVLCFGLAHPHYQGMGIGAALVLARLSLLDPAQHGVRVFICAVKKSIGYYRRFGFQHCLPWKDKQGQVHPSGQLTILSTQIRGCRKLLAHHGISVPPDEQSIPVHELPREASEWQNYAKLCISCSKAILLEATICPECGWTQPPMAGQQSKVKP